MPQKKKPPVADMDLYGFVSPSLRALRDKPNKSPEDWAQLDSIESRRRAPLENIQVDTPQYLQSNGKKIPAARLNNPGNLEPRDWQVGMSRVPGERFGSYQTPEIGFANLMNSMRRYQTQGATIESFYNTYAPRFENDTEELIGRLSKRFGLDRNAPLRYIPARELAEFIAQQESSTKVRQDNGGDRPLRREFPVVEP